MLLEIHDKSESKLLVMFYAVLYFLSTIQVCANVLLVQWSWETGVWNLMTVQHLVSVFNPSTQANAVGASPPGATTLPVGSARGLFMVAAKAMIIVSASGRSVNMCVVSGIMQCLLVMWVYMQCSVLGLHTIFSMYM